MRKKGVGRYPFESYETSEKALGIATETEILVGSLRASAIQ